MQRILFVDDEPKLLSGLRRMLRGMRSEWTFEFAESGPTALRRLDEQPFDVVVSDMRMPGMDGSELLRHVRERFPATVRIVLSGQCEQRAVLKAVGPAHQFLTKPCNSEALKETLGRVGRLGHCMPAGEAKALASRVESLPSAPESRAVLTAELEAAHGAADWAGRIIAADPAMAARVLQLVNSGFFGSPQPMVDPRRAAGLLGHERLRELAGSTGAFAAVDLAGPCPERLTEVIERSGAVAEAAWRIARAESDCPHLLADARWGGLLHDVGSLVLMQEAADQYTDLLAASGNRDPVCGSERQAFGADHAAIGAYLLALWGLPRSLVRITALHHAPRESDDRTFTALTAVHAANVLCREPSAGTGGPPDNLDYPYLERIGTIDRVAAWAELCRAAEPERVMA